MAKRNEVELFLNQFKVKLEVFGVFFLDNREKYKAEYPMSYPLK